MAVVGLLPKPRSLGGFKISATQAAITGTGAVATGLSSISVGGATASVANSATVTPWSVATISSIAGGTVNVVVLALAAAPTIAASAAPINVNVIAIGS